MHTAYFSITPLLLYSYVIGRFIQSTMEELKIKIKNLEDDIQLVLNKVDSFSQYGRTPTYEERLTQLRLLEEYKEFVDKKLMLQDLLDECIKNAL